MSTNINPPTQSELCLSWLHRFIAPGQWTELRCLKVENTGSPSPPNYGGIYNYDTLPKMVSEALAHSGKCYGVYFVVNPINPEFITAMQKRTPPRKPFITATVGRNSCPGDADILHRRWLIIDIDPVRRIDPMEGIDCSDTDVSATDEEKLMAFAKAKQIAHYLCELGLAIEKTGHERAGWEAPDVFVDSGNGCHLYYEFKIPAANFVQAETFESCDMVSRFLESLSYQFSDDFAKIDMGVSNPCRIVRFPGTLARKGINSAKRPHRLSSVLDTSLLELPPF
jgi:hypothetical protein